MGKRILILAVTALLRAVFCDFAFCDEIIWQDISRGNLNFQAVLPDSEERGIIFAGTRNAVLKSEDAGRSWRTVFLVKGANRQVNQLSFDKDNKNGLYAATGNGLYYSDNLGKNWNRAFRGRNCLENLCTNLAVLKDKIYLGTKGGLFISTDKAKSWKRCGSKLGDSRIYSVCSDPRKQDHIYAACANGVYKSFDGGNNWKRILVSSPAVETEEEQEDQEEESEDAKNFQAKYIAIDYNEPCVLYLATSLGVYKSVDSGSNWGRLNSFGMLSRDTNILAVSRKSELFAVSNSGFFMFKDDRWQELSLRLIPSAIKSIALDEEGNVYAACQNGLFRANTLHSAIDRKENITSLYYKNEPGINEVQQAAIQYAEVEPEKISLWRERAAKKAYLPRVNLGVNRNVTDLWHWETGSTTKTDDDALRRGKDAVEWSLSFSWDLAEIIWSSEQTSIDVRSKLMVQLRGDILDEITKLYFERLRVKMELDNLPIEDRKKWIEKELRIKELTASLDALTGGYFSRNIR